MFKIRITFLILPQLFYIERQIQFSFIYLLFFSDFNILLINFDWMVEDFYKLYNNNLTIIYNQKYNLKYTKNDYQF
jgi:hypothetical protein